MTKEQLKQLHQSIPPPPELAGLVAETIAAAPFRQRRRSFSPAPPIRLEKDDSRLRRLPVLVRPFRQPESGLCRQPL